MRCGVSHWGPASHWLGESPDLMGAENRSCCQWRGAGSNSLATPVAFQLLLALAAYVASQNCLQHLEASPN
jgi:hypothetical protein